MAKKDWAKKSKKNKNQFDFTLFFITLGLSFFGVLMVYNASVVEAFRVFQDKYYYLKNQALWLGIGFLIMLFLSRIDYHIFKKISGPIFFINLILLVLVLIPGIGTQIKGARRWLNLGFFSLQPSELVKLTFSAYLACWFQKKRRMLHFFLLIILVSCFIILEPDLGTLLVIAGNAFLLYFLAGASVLKLGVLGIVSVLTGALLVLTSPYRKSRLLTFLNPSRDPLGSSYHIRQVLIALATGGFFGLGLGQSRQKYEFLPEATTDSIFAIIAEEIGFIGASVLILVFLFLVLKGFNISAKAKDKFGHLLAGGISGWLGVQVLINLAAMVALIPLTGLPLPFISYGGSSLIVAFAGIGILLNIARTANF